MCRTYIEAAIRKTRDGKITRGRGRRIFFEYLEAYDEMDPEQVMKTLSRHIKPKEIIIAIKIYVPGKINEEWKLNKHFVKCNTTTLNGNLNPNILVDYAFDDLTEILKEAIELSHQGLSEAEIDEIIGFSYR